MSDPAPAPAKIRIDKWLWFARVAKTRTLSKKLVQAGKIRVGGSKTSSPSLMVGVSDVLTITLKRRILVYVISDTGNRRGPASEAQLLYKDLSPPVERTVPADRPAMQAVRDRRAGKPNKRERRKLSEFRSRMGEQY